MPGSFKTQSRGSDCCQWIHNAQQPYKKSCKKPTLALYQLQRKLVARGTQISRIIKATVQRQQQGTTPIIAAKHQQRQKMQNSFLFSRKIAHKLRSWHFWKKWWYYGPIIYCNSFTPLVGCERRRGIHTLPRELQNSPVSMATRHSQHLTHEWAAGDASLCLSKLWLLMPQMQPTKSQKIEGGGFVRLSGAKSLLHLSTPNEREDRETGGKKGR